MRTFYVLHLNPNARGLTDRYAVMQLDGAGALAPLWGDYISADPGTPAWNRAGRKAAKAWPYMVFYPRPASAPDRYPAFHFAVRGYGFNKLLDLAEALSKKVGEPVTLRPVTGWNSSPISWPQG